MTQKIKEIKITDLVLWTENPRDAIDPNATDQDIADSAWINKNEKWNLLKLAKDMKTHYDFSELPTVVYHGNTPIVYDGNRRMILAKLFHGCVILTGIDKDKLPTIPILSPCNVCSKEIAVQNVYRKHADSGSWAPLDRDIFVHKFFNEPKSAFLKLEEATGIISANPHLNKVFVKDEIFSTEKLNYIGFEFENDELLSKHSPSVSKGILENISNEVALKNISTRKNRGNVIEVLNKNNQAHIDLDSNRPAKKVLLTASSKISLTSQRLTKRTKKKATELFNGILYLKSGPVSDLYRDIVDLYKYYDLNKDHFSQYFPSLIRMSMRLLCEAAAEEMGNSMDEYLKLNFKLAKKDFDSDIKTTLFANNVSESSITQLLHIGAHNYHAAKGLDQTIAISMILGAILKITHGK